MAATSSPRSRIGFHYFPDDAHYREVDMAAWLPELAAMGVSWLTLTGSPSRGIPEHFIRGLIANQIEPVIHLPVAPIQAVDKPALFSQMQAYASWGVRYVVVFAEPNSRRAWTPADWAKIGLTERFVEILLPCLAGAAEAGLTPVFPPLAPGGDFWDTTFLEDSLEILQKRAEPNVLDRLAFGAYLWTYNRPLEWGRGGAARWPLARPYLTPPNSQDQRGFHVYEWYDEIVREHLGESRPIICVAGGARLGDSTDPRYPAVDEARQTSANLQIANAAVSGELPETVANVSFWLLAAATDSPMAAQAAFRPDGTTAPFVAALKQMAFENKIAKSPVTVPTVSAAIPKTLPKNGVKPLYHYVLLPVFEWGVSDWHWNAALEYIKAFRPAVGFSPNEAALARYITIVGNEQGVTAAIEQALKTAGCVVDRVSGKDGEETQAQLISMAQHNQRFQPGVEQK
jgi:hypothetical protein